VARPLALSALLVVSAVGCSEDEDQPPAQPANTVVLDGTVANDHGSASVTASGEHVSVTAGDFFFEPTVITGPAGEAVVLDVASDSENIHNVTAEDVDEDIGPGETVQVQLTLPDSGTAVFVCSYHRDRGMAGALVAT
jgi:plastocyanin